MSLTVTLPSYSAWCQMYNYGREMIESLPSHIVEALDDYFDGMELDEATSISAGPDNLAINGLTQIDHREFLVDHAKVLTKQEATELEEKYGSLYAWLQEDGRVDDIVHESMDKVDFAILLGADDKVFYAVY